MERVTKADLASVFDALKAAALAAGVEEASRWHLVIGSKTYGNAYRIWLAHPDYERAMADLSNEGNYAPGWSAHYTPIGINSYLGMTAREALEAMSNMKSAFYAVIDAPKYGQRP